MDDAVPVCVVPMEEACAAVGIPSTVVYPMAAVVGEPVEAVDFGRIEGVIFQFQDVVPQGWGEGFVGIDAEDPGVCGEAVGVVFLSGVAFPAVVDEACAGLGADLLGGVGGSGVDDDDFIGDSMQGLEASPYVALLVLGDYDGGDVFHVIALWR